MVIREIQQFAEVRPRARAYLCYLFTRNMPNRLPEPSLEVISAGLDKIVHEVEDFEALYLLNHRGEQVMDNITEDPHNKGGMGQNRSAKSYYYRAVREKRCVLSDPYPSSLTNDLTVTASFPIYDDQGSLKYIACIDVSLEHILKIAHPSSLQSAFGRSSQIIYTIFSLSLLAIAMLLLFNGMRSLFMHGLQFDLLDIKAMFESTILITLSLAIFDLVKTIFEEEVLGRNEKEDNGGMHKTMVRFLGSIIIALAIEALMLVFKFAIIDAAHILYAVYLIGGVTMLLFGLAFYLKSLPQKRDL
ncbi:MAG: PDC sensor domain-containing protein [Sulfurospirillaceae bacterium]|nr:PDC sensor domain-containing protein [Sulfurospirillaceae bacterium]MDD2826366.1 PDC sensor domain-containing protein [Sulfurospirillaceae bacterium]